MSRSDKAQGLLLRAAIPFWAFALGGTTLAWALLGCPWVAVLGHIALLAGVFRLWHRALHDPRSGPLYRQHERHHLNHSSRQYLATSYHSEDGLLQELSLGAAALVLLAGSAALGTAPRTLGACSVAYASLIVGGGWMHRAMHVSGHWLGRFGWFRALRSLHVQHHIDTATNLGIIECGFDALAGTLRLPGMARLRRAGATEAGSVAEDAPG